MKARAGSGGFTLLEVVVAMTILAGGIVALMSLLRGSLALSGGARDVTTASLYASQRLEEALLAPDAVPGEAQGSFDGKYRWSLASETLPAEEGIPVDGQRFRVTVSWDDGGRPRAVALAADRWRRRAGKGG